ncbi:MAG TPA: GntR family transcriptional regulator [Fimbriimonas sp.]|nr:GntR family transcriptional regulator [Fimbriimonas sp.]
MTWRRIAEDIQKQIQAGELLPGTRVESEESMALRLKVSRHTTHRALSELQRQGLLVRQRRWGTVVANQKPTSVKNQVAYLVDFTSNRLQADIMSHIEQTLGDETRLLVATSRNDHEREAEQLLKLADEVDGVICYPCDGDVNANVFVGLARTGYPLVLVDRAPRGCEELVVLTDNVQASQRAVSELIHRGHQRIAFFGTNNDHAQSIRERFLGYRSAVEPLGYSTKPYERWIPIHLGSNDESMIQSVCDALVAMRALPEPPTAAFCAQDWLAVGLSEACRTLGLVVGLDFGIATYNDFGPAFFRQPYRMDRVVQQMGVVSSTAVARLRALMRRETVPTGPIRVPALFHPAEDSKAILDSSLSLPLGAPSI